MPAFALRELGLPALGLGARRRTRTRVAALSWSRHLAAKLPRGRRAGAAGRLAIKTLDGFEFAFAAGVPERKLLELASLSFFARNENVVLLSRSGVGKTRLAIALGYAATQAGIKARLITAADLLLTLTTTLRQNQLGQALMRGILAYSLPTIDEIDSLSMLREQANLLFQGVVKRYECGSLILSSNLGFAQWSVPCRRRDPDRRPARPPTAFHARRGPPRRRLSTAGQATGRSADPKQSRDCQRAGAITGRTNEPVSVFDVGIKLCGLRPAPPGGDDRSSNGDSKTHWPNSHVERLAEIPTGFKGQALSTCSMSE